VSFVTQREQSVTAEFPYGKKEGSILDKEKNIASFFKKIHAVTTKFVI